MLNGMQSFMNGDAAWHREQRDQQFGRVSSEQQELDRIKSVLVTLQQEYDSLVQMSEQAAETARELSLKIKALQAVI